MRHIGRGNRGGKEVRMEKGEGRTERGKKRGKEMREGEREGDERRG